MLLVSLSVLSLAMASNYPPDYPVSTSCQSQGPVQNNPRLGVTYDHSGYLYPEGSPLSAWVQINGQSGQVFGSFVGNPTSSYYTIGSLRDVRMCYHPTKADNATTTGPYSGYPRCPVNDVFPLLDGAVDQGYYGWGYTPAPENEASFIRSAGTGRWSVQVAIVNAAGHWDSLYGANYRFEC
ncbi:hypothetical protein HDU91_006836 [Kappamyces sp. JEL0680]|nr:hypothetical protein HDU91_006836 [Kappamyces sp. JEL0680]